MGILQLRYEMYCQFINFPMSFNKKRKQQQKKQNKTKTMNTVMTDDRLKSLELKNVFY